MDMQAVVNDPNGCTADAAGIIQRDPALGTKVLRLVNSPISGVRNPVTAIPLAGSILGLKVLHNVIVQATVLDSFKVDTGLRNFDVNWLWDHSFKTAMAARILVREATFEMAMSIDDAYTGGLIHDIGKIILLQNHPKKFAKALQNSNDIPLCKGEETVFGFTHASVGGLLAQRWKLAPILQAAVMNHHAPDKDDPETWAVGLLIQVANTLAHQAANSDGGYIGDRCDEESMESLGINPQRLKEITKDIQEVGLE